MHLGSEVLPPHFLKSIAKIREIGGDSSHKIFIQAVLKCVCMFL